MCGIVGYLGERDPKEVLIYGLQRLEYRGYDSAGVAIWDPKERIFRRLRSQGKLKNLQSKIADENFHRADRAEGEVSIGIGHTRWATHGVPSERNAHPHQVDGISLVHNGIIENYLEIKEGLLREGAQFSSDTDSELVAHLISLQIHREPDLLSAVFRVLPQLRGAFSVLVCWDKQPHQIVAFKDGPPLVVGYGEGENGSDSEGRSKEFFIVSDVQAALQYTKSFVYLNDREVVRLQGQISSPQTLSVQSPLEPEFFEAQGRSIRKPLTQVQWSEAQAEKCGFSHFMLKEIFEQPRAVSSALLPHIDLEKRSIHLRSIPFEPCLTSLEKSSRGLGFQGEEFTREVLKTVEKVVIVACGTSYYAGLTGKYLIERLAHLPVEVDIASEYRYRHPILTDRTLVITISQSGETADTLAALRLSKEMGACTLSICNVKGSSIDRESCGHMYMNSGPEIGVASTKAFISTLALLNVLALAMGRTRGVLGLEVEREHVEALLLLPSQLEAVLGYNKYFEEAASTLEKFRGFLYLGRGMSFPIALEGALKMKELAYRHAEGYAAGEMKHGPLALIDPDMAIVVLAPRDLHYEKTLSNLEEAKARGGKILSIGTSHDSRLEGLSERYLGITSAHWSTQPILNVVPLQLMAFHVAHHLGHDVDQPRNLAKSVTVE